MFSRRDALKLGAAGLITPALRLGHASKTLAMQEVAASWPVYGGNPARTGVMPGPGPRFDAPLMVKWDWSTIPAGGWSTPVVHQGMLYQFPGDNTGLLAIDFETGTERWRALSDENISAQIAAGDTIFVSANNTLIALDAGTGHERWRTLLQEDIVGRSMVEVDGSIYCRTYMGGVAAVNAADGIQRWFFEERADDRSLLAVDNGMLYFASAYGTLFALETETGTEHWQAAIQPPDLSYPDSNVIVAEGSVYLRDYQGIVYAFDPVSGEERWQTPAGTLNVLSAVHDGRLFGSSLETGAFALDATSGQQLWNTTTLLPLSVSGVCGDTVLAQGTGGAREMWWVYGLDAATGEERWGFESYPRMYDPTIIGDRLMLHGLVGYVLVNPSLARLGQDVVLRGAPSATSVERGAASAGAEITNVGARDERSGETWVEISVNGITGWIPFTAIDASTLPPEGEVEPNYVYIPQ